MKTAAIIAEYNPLHNGHKYHIEETRKLTGCEGLVVVMSGNFVERGEPAVLNKYERSKMALMAGADLVVELPTVFSVCGAESFAKGAVSILKGLGINVLSFGSETGDGESLMEYAKVYANEPEEFRAYLRNFLDEGNSYPKAREQACRKYLEHNGKEFLNDINTEAGKEDEKEDGKEKVKTGSNDILAIEYLKQIILLETGMKAISVKRNGQNYNDGLLPKEGCHASATSIRNNLENVEISKFMPEESFKIISDIECGVKLKLNDFYNLFRYKLLSTNKDELESIYGAGEGLTNRIKNEIRYASSFEELTERVISKRYTKGRLQRLYLQILMGITKDGFREISESFEGGNGYARILGFNKTGAKLIKEIKKSDKAFSIITNINKEAGNLDKGARLALDYDILSSDIYNTVSGKDLYENSDYVKMPISL